MQYFLLVYDRQRGMILDSRAYKATERESALDDARRAQLERGFDSNIEVVVLGGSSWDDLKKTHGRYFKSTEDILAST